MTNDEDGMLKKMFAFKKSGKTPLFRPKVALFRSWKTAKNDHFFI